MVKSEFEREQFNLAYPDGVENNYWSKARNKIIFREIKKNGLRNDSFIEIGCGRGGVVKFLSNKGIDCFGVELAKINPHKGAENLIMTGKSALDLDQKIRYKYTVLMLLDVIEHIEEPISFLNQLLEHFPNIKTILITVPARQELWSNYDDFYGHFRRYDLKMTTDFFKSVNYKPVSYYFFHSLFPPARLLLKFHKKRSIQISSPSGFMKIIHSIISYYFYIENLVLPKFWKGTSILGIGKKPCVE